MEAASLLKHVPKVLTVAVDARVQLFEDCIAHSGGLFVPVVHEACQRLYELVTAGI